MSNVKDLNDTDWPALGEDTSSATSAPSKTSKKKGSKNRWRPLVIEPQPMESEDRRHGARMSRRKDHLNNNSETNGSKKSGTDNSIQQNRGSSFNVNVNSPPDKSMVGNRGSRRGGRGRGRGGANSISNTFAISNNGNGVGGSGSTNNGGPSHRGGRNRGYDSGRVTPSQGVHEDFLTDIQYYVDYSPISDASLSTEVDVDSATLSPTGPFVTPGIVPTTTAFVPTYFPYATIPAILDPIALKKCIKAQIEYYFSEENLQRDFFLRRRMDKEGYLPISLIASFHRVKTLTSNVEMVIDALRSSDRIEFNEDGLKVRTAQDPEKWPIFDQRTQ